MSQETITLSALVESYFGDLLTLPVEIRSYIMGYIPELRSRRRASQLHPPDVEMGDKWDYLLDTLSSRTNVGILYDLYDDFWDTKYAMVGYDKVKVISMILRSSYATPCARC